MHDLGFIRRKPLTSDNRWKKIYCHIIGQQNTHWITFANARRKLNLTLEGWWLTVCYKGKILTNIPWQGKECAFSRCEIALTDLFHFDKSSCVTSLFAGWTWHYFLSIEPLKLTIKQNALHILFLPATLNFNLGT